MTDSLKDLVAGIKTDSTGKAIGRLAVDGLRIDVAILDIRKVWARIDYLVTPLQGSGEKWVSSDRVTQD